MLKNEVRDVVILTVRCEVHRMCSDFLTAYHISTYVKS